MEGLSVYQISQKWKFFVSAALKTQNQLSINTSVASRPSIIWNCKLLWSRSCDSTYFCLTAHFSNTRDNAYDRVSWKWMMWVYLYLCLIHSKNSKNVTHPVVRELRCNEEEVVEFRSFFSKVFHIACAFDWASILLLDFLYTDIFRTRYDWDPALISERWPFPLCLFFCSAKNLTFRWSSNGESN